MLAGREYQKAKALLEEHLGSEQQVASAYMDKAPSRPVVKAEDAKSLQAHGLSSRGCCNGMDGVEFMSELNIPANTVIVVIKLPYRLRDRWRAVASDIPETRHRRATFPDIMAFTERQVKLAVEPVSGSVQDAPKTMQSKDVHNDR